MSLYLTQGHTRAGHWDACPHCIVRLSSPHRAERKQSVNTPPHTEILWYWLSMPGVSRLINDPAIYWNLWASVWTGLRAKEAHKCVWPFDKKWPVPSESGKLWINCIYETVRGSEDLKSTVISLLSREESKRGLCTNLKIKMNAFVYMVEFKWKNVTMVFRILLLILMYYCTK